MSTELEMILRLLLAAVLGGAIGYQRERARRPAGLRTHSLITIGAALFTIVSILGFGDKGDPSRIAAGVVTGIGFLGAGVIFHSVRDTVPSGLTTAASVWAAASVGIAAGVGLYLIATVVTILIILVLLIPKTKT